jgi:isopenicillin N synthase-like dioxygenase
MASIVPVIDISAYLEGDKSQIPRIIGEIDRAFRTSGFFQLVGHGITQSQIDGMIQHTADFFSLPDETKRKIHGKMRGYQSPDLRESLSSTAKEGFFMGRHLPGRNRPTVEGNLWLKEEEAPGFRHTMEEYYAAMENLAVTLLRLIALGLGLDETYFDDFAKQPEGLWICLSDLVNAAHIYLQVLFYAGSIGTIPL